MFGNAKGWAISAVIVVLTAGLIFYASRAPQRSQPTGQLAVAMKSSDLGVDLRSIVPPGTKDEDAGDLLRDLADKVKDKRKAFDKFEETKLTRDRRLLEPTVDQELKKLLDAAQCAKLSGLAKPDELVVYGDKPYLSALKRVANAAVLYGQTLVVPDAKDPKFKPDPAKARKYFEASFTLGRMLYEDRVIFKQWRDGVDIMNNAAFNLGALYGKADPELKAKCDALRDKLESTGKPAREAWADLSHTNRVTAPGDVFLVAEKSPDPMWRSEALLKLGRIRWMQGAEAADQRDAKLVLEQTVAQPGLPPAVRVAADRALKLDASTFQETDREP